MTVASLAGLTGVPTRTGYAASKHAVFGFFESLRASQSLLCVAASAATSASWHPA